MTRMMSAYSVSMKSSTLRLNTSPPHAHAHTHASSASMGHLAASWQQEHGVSSSKKKGNLAGRERGI